MTTIEEIKKNCNINEKSWIYVDKCPYLISIEKFFKNWCKENSIDIDSLKYIGKYNTYQAWCFENEKSQIFTVAIASSKDTSKVICDDEFNPNDLLKEKYTTVIFIR